MHDGMMSNAERGREGKVRLVRFYLRYLLEASYLLTFMQSRSRSTATAEYG